MDLPEHTPVEFEPRVAVETSQAPVQARADLPREAVDIGLRGEARAESEARQRQRAQFQSYAATWKRETQHLSSLTKIVSHPSYKAIIEMGEDAVPLILEELRDRPDHWLYALDKLTKVDPVRPAATFMEAVEDWLAWGRKEGYLK